MDNVNLSQSNQVYISNQTKSTTASAQSPINKQDKDNRDKINKVLIGLGVLGAASIAVACIIHGKKPKNIPDTPPKNDIEKVVKSFEDIDFVKKGNHHYAVLKNGEDFTGTVEKITSDNEKLSIEYINGVIKKSTKTTNGTEIVKEYSDGVISKKNGQDIDIKKIQNEVKESRAQLTSLKSKKEQMSTGDYLNKFDNIKYTSQKDKLEILEEVKDELSRTELEKRINKIKKTIKYPSTANENSTEVKKYYELIKKLNDMLKNKPYSVSEVKFSHSTLGIQAVTDKGIHPKFVEAKASNGDKILMEFDCTGNLIKTTRTGKKPCIKSYKYGNVISIDTLDGNIRSINLAQTRDSVKYAQNGIFGEEGIKHIVANAESKSYLELEQAANRQYVSLEQKRKLLEIADKKKLEKYQEAKKILDNPKAHYLELKKLDTNYELRKTLSGEETKELAKRLDSAMLDYWEETYPYYKKSDTLISFKKYNTRFQTTEEAEAFSRYQAGSSYVNPFLREEKIKADLMFGEDTQIYNLDKAIKNSKPLEEDCIVYRGISRDPYAMRNNGCADKNFDYTVGEIIHDWAYTSTGIKPNCANVNNDIVWKIHLPKGTKGILGAGTDQPHPEYLLPRDSSFKVMSFNKEKNIVEVEYILPNN